MLTDLPGSQFCLYCTKNSFFFPVHCSVIVIRYVANRKILLVNPCGVTFIIMKTATLSRPAVYIPGSTTTKVHNSQSATLLLLTERSISGFALCLCTNRPSADVEASDIVLGVPLKRNPIIMTYYRRRIK
jgi:hypothetical protein